MPCNFHLRGLAEHVKEGVRAAGGTPLEFNSIAISDGITMGTEGMKTSLVSREVIADSIELTARGYQFDAVIALSGCDKTIPGCVMALARLDIPSLMLYGGLDPARPLARPGRDDPGRLRGDRQARHRRDVRRRPLRARGLRQPRSRRLRRPVHREHDGLRLRGDGDHPDGLRDGPRGRRRARAGGARDRRAGHEGARRRPAPEPDHHQGLDRERDRHRLRCRAARPTASSICSRSPTRPASSSPSTTSTGSPRRRRCSAT